VKKLQELSKHLRPGRVYRREALLRWSTAVDRHLKQLLEMGKLTKLSTGLYLCPETTVFGNAPASEHELVEAFLKDNRFLVTSPNAYNALGVGVTQLYNETVVYNHKRHGEFSLGGRVFKFRRKPHFPKQVTPEFLLVDLVDNLDRLAEDRTAVLAKVKRNAARFDAKTLSRTARDYGMVKTKKFFASLHEESAHAA
jgi:hypothetical protein